MMRLHFATGDLLVGIALLVAAVAYHYINRYINRSRERRPKL